MRWKEIIKEAPIADFGTFGDMNREGSFRTNDLKAMTNPKWQAKLHRMFEKTEFPINLYLFNAPDDVHTPATFDSPAQSRNSYRDLNNISRWSGIRSKDEIERLLDRKFSPADYEQAITVVLVENEGDARVALTPWMVAHRISHAFLLQHDPSKYYDISRLVESLFSRWNQFIEAADMRFRQTDLVDYLEILERHQDAGRGGYSKFFAVSEYLGLTKGMRKLSNPGEFLVESFAQFMVQGRVSYRRVELPGYERRRPLTTEEMAFIQDSVRDYYHGSVDTYIEKRYPSPPVPKTKYVGFDAEGVGMVSFSDPERIEHYRSRGLTVKEIKPSWQSKKKYAAWEAKVAEVRDMWKHLEAEGRMAEPLNRTELLDSSAEDFEEFLNGQFRAIMVRCIGKFLVL